MSSEFRYDRLTGEWVNIVAARQSRPNLPTGGCPFCVGGLEAPDPYETRWIPNRWPAFEPGEPVDVVAATAAAAASPGPSGFAGVGAAEVILYSPVHDGSLGSLGVDRVAAVVDLWAERTAALLARPEIRYVLVFESRGTEVGATIHHPHGQVYGYPFVPPGPALEAEVARRSGDTIAAELAAEVAASQAAPDGGRVVFDGGDWVAWVPYAARYPYELRVAPRTVVGRLDQLDAGQRRGLAEALVDVLGRYDRLWAGQPGASAIFPYLMWFHQAPADDPAGEPGDAAGYHLHLHLAPPQRSAGVARFVAAGELGSGTFSNPVAPEAAAAALREA